MTNQWEPLEPVEFEHDGSYMLKLNHPEYLASGETEEEARLNFWRGLALTLWERGKAGLPLDGSAEGCWWCPECQKTVLPINVTHDETHDERAGGCGHKVLANPPAPQSSNPVDIGAVLRLVKQSGFSKRAAFFRALEELNAKKLEGTGCRPAWPHAIEILTDEDWIAASRALTADGSIPPSIAPEDKEIYEHTDSPP